jgi:hypothetical protein
MATHKSEEPFEQVLKLIEQLTPVERVKLQSALDNKAWGDKLEAIFSKIDERTKGKPPISEDEIMDEVFAVREEIKAEHANQSSL